MNGLKRARMLRGIRGVDLANEVGIAPTTLVNYESGLRNPGPKLLPLLAGALNVSQAWLRGVAPSLPVYCWADQSTRQCPIVSEQAIDGYGTLYVVDYPELDFLPVILASGVQFTPNDCQAPAIPQAMEDIAEIKWIDPYGDAAIMLDGLPRLLG